MQADEDIVQSEGHDGTDGSHDDGGHAHGINAPDNEPVGPEALERQGNFRILSGVEVHAQGRAHHLAQYRGPGRAGDAHVFETRSNYRQVSEKQK